MTSHFSVGVTPCPIPVSRENPFNDGLCVNVDSIGTLKMQITRGRLMTWPEGGAVAIISGPVFFSKGCQGCHSRHNAMCSAGFRSGGLLTAMTALACSSGLGREISRVSGDLLWQKRKTTRVFAHPLTIDLGGRRETSGTYIAVFKSVRQSVRTQRHFVPFGTSYERGAA